MTWEDPAHNIRETYQQGWIWAYKQVCTQDNVAGGTLRVDITIPAGQIMRVGHGNLAASGNRAVQVVVRDSAGTAFGWVAVVAAAAGATACWPCLPTASTGSAAALNAQDLRMYPGEMFSGQVTSAAQTETATLDCVFLLTTPTQPTVSWANSGGTPTATAAAINTITRVNL
jgi:hypothetical protein